MTARAPDDLEYTDLNDILGSVTPAPNTVKYSVADLQDAVEALLSRLGRVRSVMLKETPWNPGCVEIVGLVDLREGPLGSSRRLVKDKDTGTVALEVYNASLGQWEVTAGPDPIPNEWLDAIGKML